MVPCEVETPAAHGKLGQIWPGRHEGKEESVRGGAGRRSERCCGPATPLPAPPPRGGSP